MVPACALLALTFFQFDVYGQTDRENTEELIASASADFIFENRKYVIVEGSAYEIDEKSGRSRFVMELYEPGYISKHYREQDGIIYRVIPDSSEDCPVITDFSEGFEGVNKLSHTQEGVAELWLDGELVIRANGQTLPMSDTVLTRLGVGITANPRDVGALLYVDEVVFSDNEPVEN